MPGKHFADRLDPEPGLVRIDEIDQNGSRGSSSRAKKDDAARSISFARFTSLIRCFNSCGYFRPVAITNPFTGRNASTRPGVIHSGLRGRSADGDGRRGVDALRRAAGAKAHRERADTSNGNNRILSFERSIEASTVIDDRGIVTGQEVVTPAFGAPHAGETVTRRFTSVWNSNNAVWKLAGSQATVIHVL